MVFNAHAGGWSVCAKTLTHWLTQRYSARKLSPSHSASLHSNFRACHLERKLVVHHDSGYFGSVPDGGCGYVTFVSVGWFPPVVPSPLLERASEVWTPGKGELTLSWFALPSSLRRWWLVLPFTLPCLVVPFYGVPFLAAFPYVCLVVLLRLSVVSRLASCCTSTSLRHALICEARPPPSLQVSPPAFSWQVAVAASEALDGVGVHFCVHERACPAVPQSLKGHASNVFCDCLDQ